MAVLLPVPELYCLNQTNGSWPVYSLTVLTNPLLLAPRVMETNPVLLVATVVRYPKPPWV